ncbi:MAG: carboxypeptidase regulatory-like domain-containing protein, partial [Cyanobacteria bacterium REEB65]|nr:carboxypeptidase regulatory-like domain-containing protein [Cyanobacteria bacterium REEB65]
MRSRGFWPMLAAALLAGCPQHTEPPAAVSGKVYDYPTDVPLAGVTIRAIGAKQPLAITTTDAAGGFTLTGLPSTVDLELAGADHEPVFRLLRLDPGQTRGVDLFMVSSGYKLPDETILFERGGEIWKVDPAGIAPKVLTAGLEGTQ